VLKLPGQPRTQAFWLQPGRMVLPAFSAFTGGRGLGPDRSWIACAGGALVGHGDGAWRAGPGPGP
jgi:hypothetical protein